MPVDYLNLAEHRLAYQRLDGAADRPGIIFLGGFASDMTGTKASFLAERCAATATPYIRFDYRGNGMSSGSFTDGTIGTWYADSLSVFDQLTHGKQIIVGSSMGGWIGLMLAQQRPERVGGFIGIAAAPDFTEALIRPQLTPEQHTALERDGHIMSGHAPITRTLMEEAKNHLQLNAPITVQTPVRLLQGMQDEEVPWQHALRITERLTTTDVQITLIKDGDHRLSRDQDLTQLWGTIQSLTHDPRA